MIIRKTIESDLNMLLDIYDHARSEMIKNGNPNQWGTNWPLKEVIEEDIKLNRSYVCVENNEVCGTFVVIEGIEPTYLEIEGAWLNNDDYVTIHRLASNNKYPGVFHEAIKFMTNKYKMDVRIDTHEQNTIMRHLIEKEGFLYTGVIYVYNGNGKGKRLAYQLVKKTENV